MVNASVCAQAAASAAQKRLNWPRTFTGQPDFEFERSETFADVNKHAVQQGVAPVVAPTMASLLEDTPLAPLAAAQTAAQVVSGTEASAFDELIMGTDEEGAGDAELAEKAAQLPDLDVPMTTDLTEFSHTLVQSVVQYMNNWQPDLQRYSLEPMLSQLQLQTVALSPEKYVVINGTRYKEGENFLVPMMFAPSDMELMAVMDRYMPTEATLPADTLKAYKEAYDAAIQQLANSRTNNPQLYQRTVNVPVMVLEISSRKVFILLNGMRHELNIKYAL